MTKVVFVFGETDTGCQVFVVFDKQSGECLADDLYRTKGGRAVVIEALVNFDAPNVQILSPRAFAEHPGYGVISERERLKDVPWWRRWLQRI
jgi:hypothetical protein